ncbi:hypothetical protein [Vannielia litorea]|uniref:DUF3757 domain-containing protein n=1 Tax=Vannielia litorea TaxID=1217970 RepID=A0A1N6H5A2_9RHOB|nr:hypothetical protein [Vannielia litorea]SIO14847.1 hypothetical protein SAMN05444002_3084 [Vannielia litorea]
MRLAALLLAATAAPAAANPAAIGEALALCIEVVKEESPQPLLDAGLEVLTRRDAPPQWSISAVSPAGIGEIRAGMDEYGGQAQTEEYYCYLHLPAANGSEAMRWEKLGLGPVMALTGEGFEQYDGSPVAPRLKSCAWLSKPIYLNFYHSENVGAVRAQVTDMAPRDREPCKE